MSVADLTPFSWDRMFVFTPYTSQEEIERRLGFRWPDIHRTRIWMDDAVVLVVFVRGDSVVAWHDEPRSLDLNGITRPEPYPPDSARFVVDSAPANGPGWLRLRAVGTSTVGVRPQN